jgi:ATP-dependent Lhr-like helicase
MYLAQGGRQLLTWFDATQAGADLTRAACQALAAALGRGRRGRFTLELINDAPVGRDALTDALRAAGFRGAPRGLDWEG